MPTGVAVDKNNNLYVADFGNNRVPRIQYSAYRDNHCRQWRHQRRRSMGAGRIVYHRHLQQRRRLRPRSVSHSRWRSTRPANLYISDTSAQPGAGVQRGRQSSSESDRDAHFRADHRQLLQRATRAAITPNATHTHTCPSGPGAGQRRRSFVADGNNNRVLEVQNSAHHRSSACRVALGEPDFAHTAELIDPASLERARSDSDRSDQRWDRGCRQRATTACSDGVTSRVSATVSAGRPRDRTGGFLFGPGQSNRRIAFGEHAMDAVAELRSIPPAISISADTDNSRVVEYNTPFAACAGVFRASAAPPNLIIGQT